MLKEAQCVREAELRIISMGEAILTLMFLWFDMFGCFEGWKAFEKLCSCKYEILTVERERVCGCVCVGAGNVVKFAR